LFTKRGKRSGGKKGQIKEGKRVQKQKPSKNKNPVSSQTYRKGKRTSKGSKKHKQLGKKRLKQTPWQIRRIKEQV